MTTRHSVQSLVQMYLDERRSAGFDLSISGHLLMSFARFADERGHRGPLTEDLILLWVQGAARRATPITWARRLEIIRPFARYCFRRDRTTHVPEEAIFGRAHRRLTPHIYTEQEIAALLQAASRIGPARSVQPATYTALFGLIASTGLRLSEALKLQYVDVDLTQAVLTIRQTKFRKSRLVPLHPSVLRALRRYSAFRQKTFPAVPNSSFFVGPSAAPLVKRTVHEVFDRLRKQLRWVSRGSYSAPRIHDLRHTFICRRVQLWHLHGAAIDNAMAALATYVGHAKVSDTYWYLTGIPDLMAVAGSNFEGFVFPRGRQRHD